MKWTNLTTFILTTMSTTNLKLNNLMKDSLSVKIKTHPNLNWITFRYLVDTELEVDTLKTNENCSFKTI